MATIISKVFKKDKVVNLAHNAGQISIGAGSILTIGGLQYTLDTTKSVSLPSLTSFTRYQIFAIIQSGDVTLVISTNENSAGPAGATSWCLVGCLYSTADVFPVFGSFVNISGVPETQTFSWTPTGSWTNNTTYTGKVKRKGEKLEGTSNFTLVGAPNSAVLAVDMPGSNMIDTTKITGATATTTTLGSAKTTDAGTAYVSGTVTYGTSTAVQVVGPSGSASQWSQIVPFTYANGDSGSLSFEVPIVGWSNTPIEDL